MGVRDVQIGAEHLVRIGAVQVEILRNGRTGFRQVGCGMLGGQGEIASSSANCAALFERRSFSAGTWCGASPFSPRPARRQRGNSLTQELNRFGRLELGHLNAVNMQRSTPANVARGYDYVTATAGQVVAAPFPRWWRCRNISSQLGNG